MVSNEGLLLRKFQNYILNQSDELHGRSVRKSVLTGIWMYREYENKKGLYCEEFLNDKYFGCINHTGQSYVKWPY